MLLYLRRDQHRPIRHWVFIFFGLCQLLLINPNAFASKTVSLLQYLDLAKQQGINTLHSTDLISTRYKVTFDSSKPVTLGKLEKALAGFDLKIIAVTKQSESVVYAIVRINGLEAATVEDATTSDLDAFNIQLGIEELVVTASSYKLYLQQQLSSTYLDQNELRLRPAIGNDPVRLVNNIPGSASVGVSARPHVRGGQQDETLIEFDGMRLYEPFHFNHFNNLFGSFDSRILSSLDFHTGAYQANYGDRLSAVMALNTVNVNDVQPIKEVGVGLYNLSYLQTGASNDADWIFNIRRSTLELTTRYFEADLGEPSFGDVFARYNWHRADDDEVSLSIFWFGDDTETRNSEATEEASSIYGNSYIWLTSSNALTESLQATSIVGFSAIKNDRKGFVQDPDVVTGSLSDDREFRVYNLKQNYDWLVNSDVLVKFGWDYRYLDAEYDFTSSLNIAPAYQQISNFPRPAQQDLSVRETGHQYAVFGNTRWQLTDHLIAELGLRYDGQHYESSLHEYQLQPRLNLIYTLNAGTQFRLGWGKYSQAEGIHELLISDGITTFQTPQKSTHFVLAWEQQLGKAHRFVVELYRKDNQKTNFYFQNLADPLSIVPELQVDRVLVAPEDFLAQGIEISFDGNFDNIHYWFNVAFSSAEDTVADVDISRTWDQSTTTNIGFSTILRGWQITASYAHHKGWLTTPFSLEQGQIVASQRNASRFNSYSSLDAKFSKTWPLSDSAIRLEMGLTNLLNHDNQIGIEYDLKGQALHADAVSGLPLAPFVDIYWRF